MRDKKGRFTKGHVGFKGNLGRSIHPKVREAVIASNKRRSGSNCPLWKGGKILHQGKYWLIHMPNHPNCDRFGYVREHRLVMENSIGRYLEKKEIVHHLNKITTDNRVENLVIMTPSEHTTHHMLERWGKKNSYV